MADTNPSVEEILSGAIDHPAEEQFDYVAKACAGNETLLKETMSLLAAYQAADDFMEEPATLNIVGVDDQDDWVGRTVGGYQLIELIDVGGMGRVYLAERADRDFTQRVAVKIIRRGAMGKEGMRRFRNECRVLAMLEHPNIARMIDGGITEEDLPYIVMEYVEGVPIDRYCSENQIPLAARLDLFLDVCGAVQVVHQHSTIHRDIKPGNILVTEEGQAKLVDFGISRVLDLGDDDLEHTAPGLELMTPKYASPEQLRREILSTATDIYSLGAVLNKVLTGRAPFSDSTHHELKQAVINEDPTRPSELLLRDDPKASTRERDRFARNLRGDLDTIVLMALRKEPERRYASVDKFAEDIRAYLDGKPVSAQSDNLRYRANKFVGRNLGAVVAAALLLVVLIGATGVSLTLYNQAESARREAVQERRIASRERNAAVSTSEFLQDLLSSVSPATIDGRLDITVREILDEASQRLESDLSDEPEVAAALHFVIGRSYMNLAEYEVGEHHLREAAALREGLEPPDEEGVLRSMIAIGQIYEEQGAYAGAESLLAGLLPSLPPAVDPAILSELETILARIYAYLSRLDDAETFARRAVASAASIPDSVHVMHAQARSELGNSFYRQGRYEEAETEYREAIATAHRTIGDRHPVTGQCYNNHALALGALGRNDEAIAQLLTALEIYKAAFPADHPEFATTHMNLADNYFITEQYDLAVSTYTLARDELVASHGEDHVMVSLTVNGLGNCYLKTERFEEARVAFIEAIERMDAASPSLPILVSSVPSEL